MYVLAYLAAIVAANLAVARWGVVADIPAALLFIAFDLSIRDRLHARWQGRGLWVRMALLIIAGSAISYALNAEAVRIALASCVAFAAASAGDALTFQFVRGTWARRAKASNVVGAAIDSILFPTIAFGMVIPWAIAGQFAAKVLGGLVWIRILAALDGPRDD